MSVLKEKRWSSIDGVKYLSKEQEYLDAGIVSGRIISRNMDYGQSNCISKGMSRNARLNELVIERISGHAVQIGAPQDLVKLGTSLPFSIERGRWSKTNEIISYLEHVNTMI